MWYLSAGRSAPEGASCGPVALRNLAGITGLSSALAPVTCPPQTLPKELLTPEWIRVAESLNRIAMVTDMVSRGRVQGCPQTAAS